MSYLNQQSLKPKRFSLANIQHFESFLLLVFFVLGLLGILNHAMWRDELNGWLIARDSASLTDFWNNIRYEGHPILWYACLYLLNQITPNAIAMQLFHLLLATMGMGLFIYFSPFSRLQKLLFTLGYLPIYEYLLISRNYAIGVLFLFAFCTFFKSREKSYFTLAIILALLANTNAYCLLITVALIMALVIEYIVTKYINLDINLDINLEITLNASLQNSLCSLLIVILGIGLSVILLMPPGDSTLQGGADQWFLQWDFHRFNQALTRIWNSYILVLVPGDSKPPDVFLFALISLGILTFVTTIFLEYPIVLCFYLIGTGGIILFTYLKFLGSARHYGHLYLILITTFWLSQYYTPSNLLTQFIFKIPESFIAVFSRIRGNKILERFTVQDCNTPHSRDYRYIPIINRWLNWTKKNKITFLMIILYAQLAAGIVSFSRDIFLPYSASREVAQYIQAKGWQDRFIIGSEDFAISPISGYLERKIYYPESQKEGSFVLFNQQRKIVNDQEILDQLQKLIQQNPKPLLLILNRKLDASPSGLTIEPIKEFTRSFIGNETYYLYEIK